jgi:hypothetical protein
VREQILIAAVEAWAAAIEGPQSPDDVPLLKALWTYRGDRPGRMTVAEAHASLDQWLAGRAKRLSAGDPIGGRPSFKGEDSL